MSKTDVLTLTMLAFSRKVWVDTDDEQVAALVLDAVAEHPYHNENTINFLACLVSEHVTNETEFENAKRFVRAYVDAIMNGTIANGHTSFLGEKMYEGESLDVYP